MKEKIRRRFSLSASLTNEILLALYKRGFTASLIKLRDKRVTKLHYLSMPSISL